MKKLNRLALTASMLSVLLCVLFLSGCERSEIVKTAKPLHGGSTKGGNGWAVICIDEVEYIFKSSGAYGGLLSVKFNKDSTISTCDT